MIITISFSTEPRKKRRYRYRASHLSHSIVRFHGDCVFSTKNMDMLIVLARRRNDELHERVREGGKMESGPEIELGEHSGVNLRLLILCTSMHPSKTCISLTSCSLGSSVRE